MADVEGRWLFAEPQPEKKRSGLGGVREFEEETKRQKVEDEDQIMDEDEIRYVDDDPEADFYEGDSDYDKDDDFVTQRPADLGYWLREDASDYDYLDEIDKKEDRCCLRNKSACNMYQHKSEFDGLFLFELFKVKLRLNNKVSPDPLEGPLCGAIDSCSVIQEPSVPIYYYRVRENQPVLINLNSDNNMTLLPIYGPETRPPIFDCDLVHLYFSFKFNGMDIFEFGYPYENPELFDDGRGNHTAKSETLCANSILESYLRSRWSTPCVRRQCIGQPSYDPILFCAYYSIYIGAWATVHVEILKKGVSSYSGLIIARPCIFRTRIRLLSIQSNQKLKLEKFRSVKLTRSVVAVPSYASLIIAAVLYDQGGKQIVRGKTFFPASEKGTESKYIEENDGLANLKVTVTWACEPLSCRISDKWTGSRETL